MIKDILLVVLLVLFTFYIGMMLTVGKYVDAHPEAKRIYCGCHVIE